MALHTDTPRPHVHVVLKAMSEQGSRLNVKKQTLRDWRAQFAANLRELGVAANATERAVRGESRTSKRTEIYRAGLRGASSHLRQRHLAALSDGASDVFDRHAREVLNRTRQMVIESFHALTVKFQREGDFELAHDTQEFLDRMGPVKSEREFYAPGLSTTRQYNESRQPSR